MAVCSGRKGGYAAKSGNLWSGPTISAGLLNRGWQNHQRAGICRALIDLRPPLQILAITPMSFQYDYSPALPAKGQPHNIVCRLSTEHKTPPACVTEIAGPDAAAEIQAFNSKSNKEARDSVWLKTFNDHDLGRTYLPGAFASVFARHLADAVRQSHSFQKQVS